eukprot:767541-Hanusia_phi.AAC.1
MENRRIRKQDEKFKPTNFIRERQEKRQAKAAAPPRAQAIQPVRPVAVVPAEPIVLPAVEIAQAAPARRVRVPKDNTLKQANSIDKKWRNPSQYKNFTKIIDDVSTNYKQALETITIEVYNDQTKNKTIAQAMRDLSKDIDPKINEANSWTNELYMYDYLPEQYARLPYIVRPTLQDFKDNKFASTTKQNDKDTISKLNVMLERSLAPIHQDDLTSVLVHHRTVLYDMFIYRMINGGQSPSTYWGDLKALTRLAKICLGDQNDLYHKLSMLSTDYDVGVLKKAEKQNLLRKNEEITFLPYSMLLDMSDKMYDDWKASVQERGKDDKKTYELHTFALILASYLWTPPVRLELNNMKITKTLNNLDKNTSYVYVNNNKINVMYIFNDRRKDHDPIKYEVGYSENKPYADKLKKFIKESVTMYPRTYYITLKTDRNKPAGGQMSDYLAKMFQNQRLNIDGLRKSFLSWLYSNNISTNLLEETALKMRNSVTVQMRSYKKLNSEQIRIKREPVDDTVPVNVEDLNVAASGPVARPISVPVPRQPHTNYVDPVVANRERVNKHIEKIGKENYNAKQKEYYKENKQKLNLKKVLYRLNSQGAKLPKREMITKYKLYQDGNTWKSHKLE